MKKTTNKYSNKKVYIDGFKFDSIAESKYYLLLKELKEAGQIKDFDLQPEFVLEKKSIDWEGISRKEIIYRADFRIHYFDGSVEIIDVKGKVTKEAVIKAKLFMARYNEPLIWVKSAGRSWRVVDKVEKETTKSKGRVMTNEKFAQAM